MNYKMIFYFSFFIFISLAGGIILIIISELIKFSHLNMIPYGGSSWAVWFHPLAIGISFAVFSKLFKIKKLFYIFFITVIVSLIIFYFVYNGMIFVNPLPFGINSSSI